MPPGLTHIQPVSTTQLPGSPGTRGGTGLPNQAGGAPTFTFSVQIHYFRKHMVIFFTPNKYSLQYSKAKVIYEACLAAQVSHQVALASGAGSIPEPRLALRVFFLKIPKMGIDFGICLRLSKINWFVYLNVNKLQIYPKES